MNAAPALLLVSEARDALSRESAARAEAAGYCVQWCETVYEAMALLASGLRIGRVVLDSRGLDRYEMTFVQLAPRYFQGLMIETAGAESPAAPVSLRESFGWTEDRTIPVAETVMAEESVPSQEAAPVVNVPEQPLSTIGIEGDEIELSLHDAVRQRMAGEGRGTPARRVPPRKPPSTPAGE